MLVQFSSADIMADYGTNSSSESKISSPFAPSGSRGTCLIAVAYCGNNRDGAVDFNEIPAGD